LRESFRDAVLILEQPFDELPDRFFALLEGLVPVVRRFVGLVALHILIVLRM
jgi:hypothetical protein